MSERIATATVRFVQIVGVLVIAQVAGYLMGSVWWVGALYLGFDAPLFPAGAGYLLGLLLGGGAAITVLLPDGGMDAS